MHYKEEEETPLNQPVHAGDDSDSDSDLDSLDLKEIRRKPSLRSILLSPRFYLRLCGRSLLWLTTIFLSGLIGAFLALHYVNLDQNCAAHTTQWSPLLDDVKVEYKLTEFDGRFMEENIYRKKGSPEVDAAWEALGLDSRAGVISYHDGLASGLDDSFVQRAPEHGGGFFVNVEGMHHLHCLNLLRKSLYFNYDYYKKMKMHAFKNDEPILQLHVTHCLDALRQVLMCNVDTGVLGQVWVESDDPNDPIAFPDFKTKHVCKNYDDIKDWAVNLQSPPVDELPDHYLAKPKPEHILKSTP